MDARLRKISLSWQFICHVEAFTAQTHNPNVRACLSWIQARMRHKIVFAFVACAACLPR